jgi:putative ABC transport system substrate-binding protein
MASQIGMFTNLKANEPEKVMRRNAFVRAVQPLVASNASLKKITLLLRHAERGALEGPDPNQADQEYADKAGELMNRHLGVYVASCWPTMIALRNASTLFTDKIVIAGMFDPNPPAAPPYYDGPKAKVYGFVSFDASIAAAWVSRLKSFQYPNGTPINQVGVVHDPRADNKKTKALVDAITASVMAAGGLGNAIVPIDVRAYDLDRQIANFATANPAGGLIVPPGTFTAIHRADLVQYINSNGIPTLYANRLYVNSGGLASYGADLLDLYQKAGAYAGQILMGMTPSPQIVVNNSANNNWELVVNAALAKKQLSSSAASQLTADADVIHDDTRP